MDELAHKMTIPAISHGPFTATPIGLIVSGKPTIEEWMKYAKKIKKIDDAIQWIIGDSLMHCEFQYGETASQMTALWPEYSYKRLLNIRYICSRIEYSRRRESLSLEHHAEVAPLSSNEQDYWLEQADNIDPDKRWSNKRLRIEIQKHSQLAKAEERKKLISRYGDNLWIGDFRKETERIKDDSIDIILTDPPYSKEAISFYDDLSRIAARVLRPSGLCLTYCGHYFLPHYYSAMGKELEYLWTGAIRHTGGESRFRKFHIHVGWKPVLIYGKPPVDTWWEWWSDNANVLEMHSDGKDKKYHEWGQPEGEAAYYLKYLCPQKGVVLDPMCGGGTVLAAAQRLELQYIGIEIDEYTALTAMQRLDGYDTPKI